MASSVTALLCPLTAAVFWTLLGYALARRIDLRVDGGAAAHRALSSDAMEASVKPARTD